MFLLLYKFSKQNVYNAQQRYLRWRKKGHFGATDPLPYFRANRDELLPIPQAEIDNNLKLAEGGVDKQKPGY